MQPYRLVLARLCPWRTFSETPLTARVLRTGGPFPQGLRWIPHLPCLQDTSDMQYANVGTLGTLQIDFPCDWGLPTWAFGGLPKYGLEGWW